MCTLVIKANRMRSLTHMIDTQARCDSGVRSCVDNVCRLL